LAFGKIARVVTVTSDRVEHAEKRAEQRYAEMLANENAKSELRKATVLKFMRGEKH
jgi:hypothetical protein